MINYCLQFPQNKILTIKIHCSRYICNKEKRKSKTCQKFNSIIINLGFKCYSHLQKKKKYIPVVTTEDIQIRQHRTECLSSHVDRSF